MLLGWISINLTPICVPSIPRRAQRDASIRAALQREGLSRFGYMVSVYQHIQYGALSEAEVLAACRQRADGSSAGLPRADGR